MEVPIVVTAIGVLFVLALAAKNPNVSRLTLVSVAFAYLLWYAIPILSYMLLPWERVGLGLDRDAYAELLVFENAGFLAVSLVLLRRRPFFSWFARRPSAQTETSEQVILWLLIAAVVGSVAARLVANILFGASYLEKNAFAMTSTAEEQAMAGGVGAALTLAHAIGYACVVVPIANRRIASVVGLWGATWVVLSVVDDLRHGIRIAVLVPLALLVLRAAVRNTWTRGTAIKLALTIVATLLAATVLSLAIGRARGGDALTPIEVIASSQSLLDSSTISDLGESFLLELTGKFNSPLGGLVLLQAEGDGAAGWRPFVGAALTLVPRYILPDKPVPGSSNGQYSGHPSRLVASHLGFDSDAGNAGVSVVAIARWELGYFGLLVLLLLGAFNLYLLNTMFLCKSLECWIVGMSIVGIPIFGAIVPTPDVAIQTAMRSLAILLVAAVIQFLGRGYRHRSI